MLLCCLSKQEGGNTTHLKKGEVEQLPVKIKGGSYVSKCEIMVFLFLCCLYVCFFKNIINKGGSANLGMLTLIFKGQILGHEIVPRNFAPFL